MGELSSGILDILLGEEPAPPRPSIAFSFARVLAVDGIAAAKVYYADASAQDPPTHNFGDRELNRLGYYFLQQGELDRAIEVSCLQRRALPRSGQRTHDSLGEAYLARGDEQLAIESYKRAAELDPDNENAREALRRLGAQP